MIWEQKASQSQMPHCSLSPTYYSTATLLLPPFRLHSNTKGAQLPGLQRTQHCPRELKCSQFMTTDSAGCVPLFLQSGHSGGWYGAGTLNALSLTVV